MQFRNKTPGVLAFEKCGQNGQKMLLWFLFFIEALNNRKKSSVIKKFDAFFDCLFFPIKESEIQCFFYWTIWQQKKILTKITENITKTEKIRNSSGQKYKRSSLQFRNKTQGVLAFEKCGQNGQKILLWFLFFIDALNNRKKSPVIKKFDAFFDCLLLPIKTSEIQWSF